MGSTESEEREMQAGDKVRLTTDMMERGSESPYLLAGAEGIVTAVRRSAAREYNRTDGKRTPILEVCVTLPRPDGQPMQLSFVKGDSRLVRV